MSEEEKQAINRTLDTLLFALREANKTFIEILKALATFSATLKESLGVKQELILTDPAVCPHKSGYRCEECLLQQTSI